MKKILAFFLAVILLLSGCQGTPAPEETPSAPQTQVPETVQSEPEEPELLKGEIVQLITTPTANFALSSEGEVFSWGKNELGVLGLGLAPDASMDFPTKIPLDSKIVRLISDPNYYGVLVQDEEGKFFAWGSNRYKTISAEEVLFFSSPIPVDIDIPAKEVQLSSQLLTLLGEDEKIYGCGWLQDGPSIHTEAGESFLHSAHSLQEIPLPTAFPIKQLETADLYRAFLNTNGEVFLQGAFVEGAIFFQQPEKLSFSEPISQLAAMYQGLVALSETGQLYFVGEDRFGIVGDDSSEYFDLYKEPVLIEKINQVASITASSSSIIVQTEAGDLFTWGYNLRHNCADSEDEVNTIPSRLDFEGSVKYLYCGEFASVCISEEGIISVWGSNVRNIHLDRSIQEQYQPTELDFWAHVSKASSSSQP